MFILLSGTDSYRAIERARFYEDGYRKKYDEGGMSVEHLSSGKEGIDRILSSVGSASLFSSRRFFRADGIVTSCPNDRRKQLLHVLSRDPEMTVVVCVEEDELTKKDLAGFDALPSFLHQTFEPLSPSEFLKWAMSFAKQFAPMSIGVDQKVVRLVAQAVQCDSWAFSTEYLKVVNGGAAGSSSEDEQIYAVIDAYLATRNNRRTVSRRFDDAAQILASVVSQTRSFALVKSGHGIGIHPYVVQKLSRLSSSSPDERYRSLVSAMIFSRTGLASAEEALDVFG